MTRPVGHLPPSVYWRRRAIVLVGLAVLIALVAWACTAGGGDDDKKNAAAESTAPTGSGSPAPIGPGPNDGAANGGPSTGSPGAPAPSGGTTGSPSGGANPGAGGNPGAANGGTVPGANPGASQTPPPGQQQPPAPPGGATVNGMLACQFPGNAEVVVIGDRPQDTKFRVGEQVKLTLEVRNTGRETCAVDMSQRIATVEIRSGNDRIWSPADCASGGQEITQIQPGKSVSRTWTWNWTRSDPARCTGPAPTLNTPPPGALFSATGKVIGMQWASQPYKWLVAQ